MRTSLVVSFAALLAVACSTSNPPSQKPAPVEVKSTGKPGEAAATRNVKVSAKVKAVDVAARTLTLEVKGSQPETIQVPPEVKRLDEIAPGDVVAVEVEQGLLLEYQAPGTESVPPQGVAAAGRAGASSAPGGAAAAGFQTTVTITAIDAKTRIVGFQDSYGESYQVKAGPGLAIEKLKVGDRLLVTYVEAVAIQVQKAAP
jgi:hypothetical protein